MQDGCTTELERRVVHRIDRRVNTRVYYPVLLYMNLFRLCRGAGCRDEVSVFPFVDIIGVVYAVKEELRTHFGSNY